ncbi:interleukin-17F-like isoform X2 [Engraulis encrasicolus]
MKKLPLLLCSALLWMEMSCSEGRCLSSRKANALMRSWLRHVSTPPPRHRHTHSHDYANRSVSPWEYRVTHVSNTFPSNIRHAVCKSGGCFIDGQEDNSFNSVPVYQSQMVLKKRP